MPSRVREIFTKARLFSVKTALGRMPEVGFHHHRWFCEIEGSHVKFYVKDQRLLMDRARMITRGELGRKLTKAESGCCLFWDDSFTWEEVFEVTGHDLGVFKKAALAELRQAR